MFTPHAEDADLPAACGPLRIPATSGSVNKDSRMPGVTSRLITSDPRSSATRQLKPPSLGLTLRSLPPDRPTVRPHLLISALALAPQLCAAEKPMPAAGKPVATFTENNGQWPENVLYRSLFPGGALFVEKDAFTYLLYQGGPLAHHGHDPEEQAEPFKAHAYRVTFEGATEPWGEGLNTQPHYENYFLGSDPNKWGSRCAVHGEVLLHDIYPGIDLRFDGSKGLKYEFVVAPGVDPSVIRLLFQGQDGVSLQNDRLVVNTTAGTVEEERPFAYRNMREGNPCRMRTWREPVGCDFQLDNDELSFAVQRQAHELVIDPSLTFGSYSGSIADNFGFTATYDEDGALYGGGIVFGTDYPTTLGVLDASFNGSNIDIGISKWSPDGTVLEWSTYLGGSNNETPHSLVVNSANELYVLAVTGSSDFPTTPGSADGSFNGGTTIPLAGGFVNLAGGEGYGFDFGTDITIAHLSADATVLLGGTFVGGSGNDGLNQGAQLVHNYGDHFRGEIALDAQERPLVASSTQSSDAPTSSAAVQSSFGGGDLDAYLFRLSADLTSLEYATFCGGSGGDSGYGVQVSSAGDIYLTGGTSSSDLPMVGTPFNPSYGGSTDGFIMRYSDSGQSLASTYIGTSDYDQCFFVQLDTQDDVYVVGQTHGAYPVTPGKYTNAGSSQFIHKLATDLSSGTWSTVIGNGNGNEDISPSAFLVSDCGQIYFSGWGGTVNSFVLAAASTTTGLPLTADAFQSTTDGSDFYLMVLEPEAIALNYATFFGGLSSEHVDGGTSRFDKNGNVYQAVCAGCQGQQDFPTTPGAWSNTNNSFNCNLGVFKFNLSQPVAEISIDGPNFVCLPNGAEFINSSLGGTDYFWDFGDSTTATEFEPDHTWTEAGTYTVTMILSDDSDCVPNDTATIIVDVLEPGVASIDSVGPVCDGGTVQLQAHGGDTFVWFPSAGLSNASIADPVATLDNAITYSVAVSGACGSDTASIDLVIGVPTGEAGPDTLTCTGVPVPITAAGGATYLWSPTASLDDPTAQSPNASPLDTTEYIVQITTAEGCVSQDTLTVNVQFGVPDPVTGDTAVCLGASVPLHVEGGDQYEWQAAPGIFSLFTPDPEVSPIADQYYFVLVSNTCGTAIDSAFVDVQQVMADAWPDTTVCPGETVKLFATGGLFYSWSPTTALSDPDSSITFAAPLAPVTYIVTATNALGCEGTATATVQHFPNSFVNAGQDTGIDFGESTQLFGYGGGSMVWSPAVSLTCDSCVAPVASPQQSTTYTLEMTDGNGCKVSDQVTVFVNGTLYVPNTFTPDGDGLNDGFFAFATEIAEFRLLVFNRWGEEIYASTQLGQPWDGTYGGVQSPIDTYVWRIDLKELNGKKRTVFGHVNLVR